MRAHADCGTKRKTVVMATTDREDRTFYLPKATRLNRNCAAGKSSNIRPAARRHPAPPVPAPAPTSPPPSLPTSRRSRPACACTLGTARSPDRAGRRCCRGWAVGVAWRGASIPSGRLQPPTQFSCVLLQCTLKAAPQSARGPCPAAVPASVRTAFQRSSARTYGRRIA